MTAAADRPINRRWLRYSLRTLLGLMLLVGIAFGWLGWQARVARRHIAVAKQIEEMGGAVEFLSYTSRSTVIPSWKFALYGDYSLRDVSVDFRKAKISDSVLTRMKGMNCVRIQFTGTQIDDEGLKHLQRMKNLRWLHLDNTAITDTGLKHLNEMTNLEWLFLSGTHITDAGLDYLQGMAKMQRLLLDDTKIADAGLKHLRGMNDLSFLNLAGTQVTDAGLMHLEGLENLDTVNLSETHATQRGVDALQAARPECVIGLDH